MIIVFSVVVLHQTTLNWYGFQNPFKQEGIIEGKKCYQIEDFRLPDP